MPSDIKDLFTEEIKKIEDLRVKASETVQALNTFEDQIKKDQSRLQDIKSAITNKLEGENGKMQRLQDMLNNEWNELHNDEDEYEKDVILACTALAYAWMWVSLMTL